jgi:putative heme d1 biosynthesis radical SAM protein NirJ2
MIISWNTTNACNLNCPHCYRDASKALPDELTTSEAKAMLQQISEAGFMIMIFSGGEPLLRDDIFELVEHARGLGLRPVFGTNGTLLNRETVKRLKESGAAAMGISLDSTDAEKHDRFRGVPGGFDKTMEGMENCREAGLRFQIHTTVMDWNYDEIEQITDLAIESGAIAHHIFFLVPTGRAAHLASGIMKAEKYEDLLERIMDRQEEVPIELKPTCAPQFMRIAKQKGMKMRFTRGCIAGIAYCLIGPTGNVQPCAYLDMNLGNVREMPFTEIWRNNEVFKELRTMEYSGSCGRCDYKDVCGGCRARAAYYHKGDYMASEPWCTYKPVGV